MVQLLQCVQVMYIFLCRYAIWDVGGVWSWLVVAQRETINAVASYDVKGNVANVFTITRQGLLHSYLALIAGSSSQMQMQAPVNAFGDDLATPKKILEVSKAVMGKSFNPNDSLCKLFLLSCTMQMDTFSYLHKLLCLRKLPSLFTFLHCRRPCFLLSVSL